MKKRRTHLWFMLPGLVFYCAFMIFPLIATVGLSFTSWDGVGQISLVGIKNYISLLTDPINSTQYFNAFWNNIKFILCEYCIAVPVQLLVAYMFYSKVRWHKFFQTMFFMPYVLSAPVIGFFALIMFNANFGIVNKALLALGVSRTALPAWLADPNMVFPLMFLISLWYSSTIGMLIILSSMKNVSHDTIEAGMIDGANTWQRFFYIILPDIGPGMINVLVLDIIWGITLFDLPYTLAGTYGGVGGKLDFVNMFFYRQAFGSGSMSKLQTDLGFAATIGAVTFIFILIFTSLMNKLLSKVECWNE